MNFSVGINKWALRPFELIYHGEVHFRRGYGYDRRLALISFDNAIEVSINAYLGLRPQWQFKLALSKEQRRQRKEWLDEDGFQIPNKMNYFK